MAKSIHYLLALATLYCLPFSMAQSILGFPAILENTPPMAGTQATHDTLRWDDFVNYENHALYGPIGKSIGQLIVSYEGIDIPFPCTATLIAENILLTNYHCVYPSKKDAYGNTHRITSARIYMDYNQPNRGRGGLRSFAVSTIPIDYSEEPDFAILSTIDTIPFETYGLKNIKIGNYRDSNSLFLIHHSSEGLASDHKRLTNRDCVAMDFSRIGTTQIALPSGKGRAAIAGHDVPHFCDTKGGASGSLIFNSRGEIVGLNFAGLRNYDHRTKRFRPEDSRFNLFIDIQALLQTSDTLSEILFGIEKQDTQNINNMPSATTVLLSRQTIGTIIAISVFLALLSATIFRRRPTKNMLLGNKGNNNHHKKQQNHNQNSHNSGRHNVNSKKPKLIRSADELVRYARQGGTLRLASGTFHLYNSLELSGDVRLIGQGYQQTRIVSSASEYVVRYTGGGTFAAQGIGFEHTGNAIAAVVLVDNGTLNIDSCQFTGGKYDAEKVQGGSGLWIIGSTQGTVRKSLFNDNGLHGIYLNGNAQPRLEQNRLHDNTQAGINYAGSAGGSAVSNESYGNGLHGIAVQDNAQPRLEQNRLHDNTYSGIHYTGSAGGGAVGNESYGNGFHGIEVKGNAQPRLEQNRLHDNTQAGINYAGSAGGSAVSNESYGNGLHGIAVQDNAQPRLEQNRLHDNTYTGIAYLHQSGGSAHNNQSYDNGQYGIYIASTANPNLLNNTTYGNRQGDIVDLR